MQKLKLTPRGIFPIIFDHEGRSLDESPRTGYTFPGTIQGEGKLAGVPSLFLRTSGCNLACIWLLPNGEYSRCDTPESSIDIKEQVVMSTEDILSTLKYNASNIQHLVVTGGEPTLQKEGLITLLKSLKQELNWHITLESNGTHFDQELFELTNLISLSPKLSSSFGGQFNASHFEITRSTIQQAVALCGPHTDIQLKFVIATPDDTEEIKALIKGIDGLRGEDILLMPLGRDAQELNQTRQLTSQLAVENGWRYSPRLHIDIWGDKPGV